MISGLLRTPEMLVIITREEGERAATPGAKAMVCMVMHTQGFGATTMLW